MTQDALFEQQRAAGYNQFVSNWIPNYHYFLSILPKLLRHTSGDRLLVAGCGTGNEIVALRTGARWQITGVDPSPEMLAQARELLGDDPNVCLLDGVVADLPMHPLFDAATLLLVLHFLPDDGSKEVLLRDIADRLKLGAPLILLDVTGDKEALSGNLEVLKLLLPESIPETEISHRLYRIANELHAVPEARFQALCVAAGFAPPTRFFQTTVYHGWLTTRLP